MNPLSRFGNGVYRPSYGDFFPKLARGHAIQRDGRCATPECNRNNPKSKVAHFGGNEAEWRTDRGIKIKE